LKAINKLDWQTIGCGYVVVMVNWISGPKIKMPSMTVPVVVEPEMVRDGHFQHRIGWLLQVLDAYLVKNGKLIEIQDVIMGDRIELVPRMRGGKGGFGSMLRAIGAQIEKTTNREACRDLSGRRLRDINEEKRLKTWIDKQAERQKEAEDQKLAKMEKLRRKPKHTFEDKQYMAQKEKQQDNLFDAVEAGTSTSIVTEGSNGGGLKRPAEDDEKTSASKKKGAEKSATVQKKKQPVQRKKQLWIDPDLPNESDLSDSSEDEGNAVVKCL